MQRSASCAATYHHRNQRFIKSRKKVRDSGIQDPILDLRLWVSKSGIRLNSPEYTQKSQKSWFFILVFCFILHTLRSFLTYSTSNIYTAVTQLAESFINSSLQDELTSDLSVSGDMQFQVSSPSSWAACACVTRGNTAWELRRSLLNW